MSAGFSAGIFENIRERISEIKYLHTIKKKKVNVIRQSHNDLCFTCRRIEIGNTNYERQTVNGLLYNEMENRLNYLLTTNKVCLGACA